MKLKMTTNENKELQQEEFLALSSIYGEESFQVDTTEPYSTYIFKLSLEDNIDTADNKSTKDLTLRFYFPPEYPSSEPPSYKITSLYCGTLKIDQNIKDDIEKNFNQLFIPGEVVIFSWIEWLQDYMINVLKTYENEEVTNKIQSTHEIVTTNEILSEHQKSEKESITNVINSEEQLIREEIERPQIIHGELFEHKKSIFIAHLAPVYNIQQVQLVRSTLLLDKKIAKATHNIMAYRIVQENGIILQDNDDDGETAAGSRLLHLLQLVDAKNVVVIVSRWFGGILLGPERFKDIQNCARNLLEECGYITNSNEKSSSGKLKNKKKK